MVKAIVGANWGDEGKGKVTDMLAEKADVPLRTIQQYEQKQKNINHARADYVIRLAKALYCRPEDLLETDSAEDPMRSFE